MLPARPHSRRLALLLAPALTLGCGPVGDAADEPLDVDEEAFEPDVPEGSYRALAVGTDEEGAPVCSDDLAADTFRYGLCVCGDMRMAGNLESASFSSSEPEDGEGTGGGVATNGAYRSAGNAEIGGTLTVGGDYAPVGRAEIAGELRVGGDLRAVGDTDVARDAYVAGDVDSIGLDVDGTLHVTDEQSLPSFFVSAEDTVVEAFSIPPPCGCEMQDDIAAFIAEALVDNDNEAVGIDPAALDGVAGDATLTLPPGRYVLDNVEVAGKVTLLVEGAAAVYIPGDIDLAGHLEVEMASDEAALDIFLGGDLAGAGHFLIGAEESAARVRLYVAGEGELRMAGHLDLGSAVYAPGASLRAAGDVELFGSVLVGEVHNAGQLRVRYDAALLDPGTGCGEPEPEEDPEGEPAPEEDPEGEPAPEEDPDGEPGPEPGAECETINDCVDPEICIEGACVFVDG